jgi:hypothetical protein
MRLQRLAGQTATGNPGMKHGEGRSSPKWSSTTDCRGVVEVAAQGCATPGAQNGGAESEAPKGNFETRVERGEGRRKKNRGARRSIQRGHPKTGIVDQTRRTPSANGRQAITSQGQCRDHEHRHSKAQYNETQHDQAQRDQDHCKIDDGWPCVCDQDCACKSPAPIWRRRKNFGDAASKNR